METIIWGVIGILMLMFLLRAWFWALLSGLGGLVAGFTAFDCIIHFQILGAIGFLFLAILLLGTTVVILEL
jgi:hypothetical protein